MSTSTLPPSIFELPHIPLPSNNRQTATLIEQAETENILAELLAITSSDADDESATSRIAGSSTSVLRRGEHNVFLGSNLDGLPAPYVALDASRPWLLYWTGHSLDILGIALDDTLKAR
jgi:protein farnesyltransferase subunit beta